MSDSDSDTDSNPLIGLEDIEDEIENELEEDLLEQSFEDAVADVTADEEDETASDDSDSDTSDEDDDSEPANDMVIDPAELEMPSAVLEAPPVEVPAPVERTTPTLAPPPAPVPVPMAVDSKPPSPSPLPTPRTRSVSPAQLRRNGLLSLRNEFPAVRTFTVEAVCALPHPVPTHSLAASQCMTHLLTGSDDGYIRDYDIFPSLNGKQLLTAPQRAHSGVVEGIMKAGQLRCWWENPCPRDPQEISQDEEPPISPVYSLVCHSDALWALSGSDIGHINLFTVRHDPGQCCHIFNAHNGPVSALAIDYDERGFFSAGWDGSAYQWELETGQVVRHFQAHGAQLSAVAVKPLYAPPSASNWVGESQGPVERADGSSAPLNGGDNTAISAPSQPSDSQDYQASAPNAPESDTKSDASFDPLFDDEPEDMGDAHGIRDSGLAIPDGRNQPKSRQAPRDLLSALAAPKGAPPLLDSSSYATFSPDILMTASVDGQVMLWDRRVWTPGHGVGRLWMSEKTPPWCLSACWSADGGQIYAGRRNGTVDVWDVRQLGRSGPMDTPRLLKTLRNPLSSGVVSCVVAFPDNKHLACASNDNLRLWNVADSVDGDSSMRGRTGAQFKIIPGHHGGYVSQMLIDPAARFLVSASSNRGWHGESTRTVFVHDIKHVQ